MQKKTIMALTGAALALYVGSTLPLGVGDAHNIPVVKTVAAAASEEAWREDVNEATRDDTMAFGIYIGKPLQQYIDEFKGKGWKETDAYGGPFGFQKKKGDYMMAVSVYPHGENKNLVGNYSVRFHVKDQDTADTIYMMAEKNFAYNFGRPSVKKGNNNMTWFLNDTFAIIVEYNEYDARMPLVKDTPYEIVIKRQMGNYKHFFQARK